MSSCSVAIIGAGPAGLTAAYLLAKKGIAVTVLEGDPRYVGGISKTVEHNGFRFDIGGHRFFSKSKEVEDLWTEILPDDMMVRPRSSRILYRQQFFSYPLKAFEALQKLGVLESALCVLSYVKARLLPIHQPRNFEDWVTNQFGGRLFRAFFKTYTEKVWGTPCTEISADWAAQRIKGLSLSRAIWNALLPKRKPKARGEVVKTLIESFRYPRLGPGMLWEQCARRVQEMGGELRMGQKVTECRREEADGSWQVTTIDETGRKQTLQAHHVISTAPVRELAGMLQPPLAPAARAAAEQLNYRDFITVAVILKERHRFDDNWIYVHDPAVQVGRIQNFKSWSPEMVPDASLTCYGMEYFCFEGRDGLWGKTDAELKELAQRELVQLGLAAKEDLVGASVVRQKKAYPVYDDAYAAHVATVRAELEARFPALHLIGRNGMHKYNNQDHSMMTAMLCAENIAAGQTRYDLWQVNEDAEYHEAGKAGAEGASASGMRQVPRSVPADAAPAPPHGWAAWRESRALVFGVVVLLVMPLLLTLGMTKGLSHDEHQHVAAGALIAEKGLLPYLDFPYFHTPYLPFAYGIIFQFTNHLLLGARLFSVACAAAALGALAVAIFGLFAPHGPRRAWLATLGGVALCGSSVVFTRVTGHAWNQEPSILCALLAFMVHLSGLSRPSALRLLVSGGLLGLAIGFRITYAPLVAPFALALWLAPGARARWAPLLGSFAAGLALSLSGLALLFFSAPEQTLFGNFEFAQVNVTYRLQTGEPRTMTVLKKLRYVWKEVMRADLGLVLVTGVSLAGLAFTRRAQRMAIPLGVKAIALVLPFLLMGSLAPSPLFQQYFYPFAFFLTLLAAYALAALPERSPWLRRASLGSMAALGLSLYFGVSAYNHLDELLTVSDWDPLKVHAEGVEIRQQVGDGDILTLGPIFVLEGGASIYPSFATGPFAWRISPFVDAAKAARLKITTPATLPAMLAANHPEGILLGMEKSGEDELDDYALQNRFRMVKLRANDDFLWVPGL